MTQVLILDCQEMKDESRYVGTASSYFKWNYLGQNQVPQPREQNWLIWPRLSGKRKIHHHIHRLSVDMLLLLDMSTVWSKEKEGFSLQGKGTLTNLGCPADYLSSPTICCLPLTSFCPGCQTKGPKTSGAYLYSDDKPWPGAVWDSMVKKK